MAASPFPAGHHSCCHKGIYIVSCSPGTRCWGRARRWRGRPGGHLLLRVAHPAPTHVYFCITHSTTQGKPPPFHPCVESRHEAAGARAVPICCPPCFGRTMMALHPVFVPLCLVHVHTYIVQCGFERLHQCRFSSAKDVFPDRALWPN